MLFNLSFQEESDEGFEEEGGEEPAAKRAKTEENGETNGVKENGEESDKTQEAQAPQSEDSKS